ncbi:MAG: phosphotransferase, partial [Candidatus Dormibacteria bacterium]
MRQWPPAGETPPPAAIDDPALRVALARSWGVRARHLQYLPKGMGSYHWVAEATAGERFFVTVDDLDRKPWLGTDRDGTFAGLNTSYETASMLHRDAGHAFVVAPLPGRSGGVLQRLTSRYCLSVFPYIEGQAGLWGEAFTPEKSVELAWLLAELHRSTPVVASRALRRGLALPGRVQLEAALDDLDPRWAGGPYSEVARQHLAGHAGTVRE